MSLVGKKLKVIIDDVTSGRLCTLSRRGRKVITGMDASKRLHMAPSWCRILMLSATAFAIEFAYVVEAAYGVPAMLKSGLTEQYASGMWAVGPVLGVLFQSYLGSASDRCKCVWGRRRPFILGLALGACIGLGLFPYGQFIGGRHFLHLPASSLRIFVPVFTALTFVAMDFCLDSLQTPTRSYLLDSVPVERSEKAVFLYTTMLGLGSSLGSLISAIPWERLGVGSLTDANSHVKIIFGVSVIVTVVCVSLTLCSVKERANLPNAPQPLARHSDFSDSEKVATERDVSRKLEGESSATDSRTASLVNNGQVTQLLGQPPAPKNQDTVSTTEESRSSCLGELHESILGTVLFAKFMSGTFFWLWINVFLTWFSYLSMYLFLTNFVGEVVYGGLPNSEDERVRLLYDNGVRMGCYCLMVLSIVIFVHSLVSEWTTGCIGLRHQLLVGHFLYFVASGLAVFFPTLLTSMLVSIAGGVCFANLNSIPYALIPQYKVSKSLFACDVCVSLNVVTYKSVWLANNGTTTPYSSVSGLIQEVTTSFRRRIALVITHPPINSAVGLTGQD